MDLSALNDDKIYYALDKIHKNQISIENHLFIQTHERNPASYSFVDYDLSTAHFVGHKCELSVFGNGKAKCHGRRQVLLGVLINEEAYPFKWDVFPGNTGEVKTLKRNINACKTRFGLADGNVTLVFDRGIICDENGAMIEDVRIQMRKDIIVTDKLLDGVCIFLTNHTERYGRRFKVTPQTIIKILSGQDQNRGCF